MKSQIDKEIKKYWQWAGITPEEYAVHGMGIYKEEFEYTNWEYLINTAIDIIELMKKQRIANCDIETLLLILALDNEREEILDILRKCFTKLNTDNKHTLLLTSIGYNQYNARWQIAELLGYVEEPSSIMYLRCLVNDIHPYVQRRALLSLLEISKDEAKMFFSYLKEYGDEITKRIVKENQ